MMEDIEDIRSLYKFEGSRNSQEEYLAHERDVLGFQIFDTVIVEDLERLAGLLQEELRSLEYSSEANPATVTLSRRSVGEHLYMDVEAQFHFRDGAVAANDAEVRLVVLRRTGMTSKPQEPPLESRKWTSGGRILRKGEKIKSGRLHAPEDKEAVIIDTQWLTRPMHETMSEEEKFARDRAEAEYENRKRDMRVSPERCRELGVRAGSNQGKIGGKPCDGDYVNIFFSEIGGLFGPGTICVHRNGVGVQFHYGGIAGAVEFIRGYAESGRDASMEGRTKKLTVDEARKAGMKIRGEKGHSFDLCLYNGFARPTLMSPERRMNWDQLMSRMDHDAGLQKQDSESRVSKRGRSAKKKNRNHDVRISESPADREAMCNLVKEELPTVDLAGAVAMVEGYAEAAKLDSGEQEPHTGASAIKGDNHGQ